MGTPSRVVNVANLRDILSVSSQGHVNSSKPSKAVDEDLADRFESLALPARTPQLPGEPLASPSLEASTPTPLHLLQNRLPEIQQQIQTAFMKARAEVSAEVADDVIVQEVTRQIWSRALIDAQNKVGRQEMGDNPERYANARAGALLSVQAQRSFQEKGFAVIDHCFNPAEILALRGEVEALAHSGRLKATAQRDLGTRDDQITWLSENEAPLSPSGSSLISQAILLQKGMALELQRALGLKLRVPLRAMAACYPGNGAKYVAHRDNNYKSTSSGVGEEVTSNRRAVTCILYCNAPDWQCDVDGGALRLHLGAGERGQTGCPADCTRDQRGCHLDIHPTGGRMVLFRSCDLLHEVLPSYRSRMAVTIWLFGDH